MFVEVSFGGNLYFETRMYMTSVKLLTLFFQADEDITEALGMKSGLVYPCLPLLNSQNSSKDDKWPAENGVLTSARKYQVRINLFALSATQINVFLRNVF